jgi:hypothetical protein
MAGSAKIVLSITLLALGVWMHNGVEALAADSKLLLARALIWGAVAGSCALLWAWRPLLRGLVRLAERAERNGRPPLVRADAAGPAERLLIALFLALCAGLTGIALVTPDSFVHLFREDGPFENATAICYALSAVACIALAVRARGRTGLRVWLALLALLFIVVGGEEISWGQRLLGFGTPEGLAEINVQEEFTLHNIYSISLFTYPALATTAMMLLVAPLLNGLNPHVRRFVVAFELPVAPLVCALLYVVMIVAYLAVGLRLGTPTPLPISYSDYVPHFDDEMMEFLVSALFTVFALSNWRLRLPQAAEASAPAAAGMGAAEARLAQ